MTGMKFADDFYTLADCSHITQLNLYNNSSDSTHTLLNLPGKQASLKIFYAISRNPEQHISLSQAQRGLRLFGDYVAEEEAQPNSHPNIRLLLDIIQHKHVWVVTAVPA